MKHHFGDSLPRDQGYWTIVPNSERYAHNIGKAREGDPKITIVTIGKDDENWSRVLTLPRLEELTLHEPTAEQLDAVGALSRIKRLRITHARPKDIRFLSGMKSVEELVLEYVSGFDDLSPLAGLKKLRALHLENLRRVVDFGGLAGIKPLRYLAIHGTLDWNQPIADVEFLRGLSSLEVLAFFQITVRAGYPAMLPALTLRKLKTLSVHSSYLPAEECALLEVGLPKADGTQFGPFHRWQPDGPESQVFVFTGRGAGRVKVGSKLAAARCAEFATHYEDMKERARKIARAR
jgi:hypothetical protein